MVQKAVGRESTKRERSKQSRRQRILRAASELVVTDGIDGLTMRRLAEASDLSVNTIYHLVGPRDAVVSALVDEVLDGIQQAVNAAADIRDAIDATRAVLVEAAAYVIADAARCRPLGTEVFSRHVPASEQSHRRGASLVATAIGRAVEAGMLQATIPVDVAAETVYSVWSSVMLRWSYGTIDDDALRALSLHGLDLVLYAMATDATRPRLTADLQRDAARVNSIIGTGEDDATRIA